LLGKEDCLYFKIIDTEIYTRRAIRIKVPDAIIAAIAIEKDCLLITRNVEDFRGISGLEVINPLVKKP